MKNGKLRLGVNIDHVATLRQVRGVTYPDLVEAALVCEKAGARGITIHLREDRRHIQDYDLYALRKTVTTHLNLEMANSREIAAIALDAEPDEVCLVPEKREELTTEGGLDAAGRIAELGPTVKALSGAGIAVSLFLDPEERQIEAAAALKVPYVELHTGAYCNASGARAGRELKRLIAGARRAHKLGLRVNAGHGINLENVHGVLEIPHLDTLNIGHSIVARSIFVGLGKAVREILAKMAGYRGGKA